MGSLIATSLFTIDAKNDRNVNSTSNLMCEKDAHIPSRQKQSIEGVPTNKNPCQYKNTNQYYRYFDPDIDIDLDLEKWNCCARMNSIMDSPKESGRVGESESESESDIDIQQQREATEAWEKEEESDVEIHGELIIFLYLLFSSSRFFFINIHHIYHIRTTNIWFLVCGRGEIRAEVGQSVGRSVGLYARQQPWPSNRSILLLTSPPSPPIIN